MHAPAFAHHVIAPLRTRAIGVAHLTAGAADDDRIMQILAGNAMAALQHAQQHLKPFLLDQKIDAADKKLLEQTLALLAYPDVHGSPVAALATDAQRHRVAKVVNSMMLCFNVQPSGQSELGAGSSEQAGVVSTE